MTDRARSPCRRDHDIDGAGRGRWSDGRDGRVGIDGVRSGSGGPEDDR